MQRVARGAYQHGRTDLLHGSEALQGIHAATRDSERANAFGSFISRPEADKRAKTKGQKDDIVTIDACCLIDSCPAIRPPVPTFMGIQDLQGSPRGSRGLVQAYILALGVG